MKRTLLVVLAVALVFSGIGAASTHGDLDKDAGMVGPASPVYGMDVAVNNAAISLGLANAGGVAQERAAEAKQAADNNNSQAAGRAAKEAGKVAQRGQNQQDAEGIDKAMTSLQDTIATMESRAEDAPNGEARQGMLTASENMKGAMNNMEEGKQNSREGEEQSDRTPTEGENNQNQTSTDGEQSNQTSTDGEQ